MEVITAINFSSSGLWREVTVIRSAPISGMIINEGSTGKVLDAAKAKDVVLIRY